MKNFFVFTFILTFSLNLYADYSKFKVDNKKTHKKTKVKLISGKKNDKRFYQGNLTRTFDASIDSVLSSILNFEDKCNNKLKKKRKLTSKKKKCIYKNKNLIESKVYDPTKEYKKEKNEIDRILVVRRIYNRSNFSHVDLVQIYETQNSSGQKVITIKQHMMSNKEAKKYFDPPVDHESAFGKAIAEYTLTQVDKNKTVFNYYYANETDHWLLNKSVAVDRVFDSMSSGINLLFKSISKNILKGNKDASTHISRTISNNVTKNL